MQITFFSTLIPMLRNAWLTAHLNQWIDRFDATDIATVEIEVYFEWMKLPLDALRKGMKQMAIPCSLIELEGPTSPQKQKQEMVNQLMEVFMEHMCEYINNRKEIQMFPDPVSGKIIMAAKWMSQLKWTDARKKFIHWNQIIGDLMWTGRLSPDMLANWKQALEEIASIYYECIDDIEDIEEKGSEDKIVDFCKSETYIKYESLYTFKVLFSRVSTGESSSACPCTYSCPNDVCCGCLDVPAEWCRFNCGHSMCTDCFPSHCISQMMLGHSDMNCPMCREKIRQIVAKGAVYNSNKGLSSGIH